MKKNISVLIKKRNNLNKAFDFIRSLIGIRVPKKTTLISLKSQHHLSTREARNLYRTAKGSRKRHVRQVVTA